MSPIAPLSFCSNATTICPNCVQSKGFLIRNQHVHLYRVGNEERVVVREGGIILGTRASLSVLLQEARDDL